MDADDTGRIRVLVAEDEATLRNTCVSVLRGQGYEVTAAADGHETLEQIDVGGHDILLLDLYIEGVSGRELLAASLERSPEVPVLVMTGNPTLDSTLELLDAGAWEYLPKPFSAQQIEMLMGRAARAVRERRRSGASGLVRLAPELGGQPYDDARSAVLDEFERQYLRGVLARTASLDEAAEAAGLDRRAFEGLLAKHGLGPGSGGTGGR